MRRPHVKQPVADELSCINKFLSNKQGKPEGFDSCNWPGNLTQNGFNRPFFSPCDFEISWMTLKKL